MQVPQGLPGGQRYKEYVVRKAPAEQKVQLSRLILPEATAEPPDLSHWAKPVRMVREDTEFKDGNPTVVPVDKERYKALLADDEQKGRARLRNMPLTLEDATKEHVYQGATCKSSDAQFLGRDKGGLEGPQTAHYFVFVLEVILKLQTTMSNC